MTKYVLRRLFVSLITIWVLITAVFCLVRLMPGDPFSDPKITPEIKANLNKYYGLDKPVIVQYGTYLNNLIHGNLGYSTKYVNQRVNDIIANGFPNSFDLGMRALVMAVSIGIVFGIVASLNRGKTLDFLCVIIAIIGTSIPDFMMGALLQYFFGIKWGLLPVAQYKGFVYTILPSIALGFYTLATVSRIMRASMLEVVQQDYIKTAKSKGISKFRITAKHQFRNAIMPIVTVMGPLVAGVLTGTFVIEAIFAVPGIGKFYVQSIQNNDYSMILGITVFYGTFLILANFVVDILYGFIDPRIRIEK